MAVGPHFCISVIQSFFSEFSLLNYIYTLDNFNIIMWCFHKTRMFNMQTNKELLLFLFLSYYPGSYTYQKDLLSKTNLLTEVVTSQLTTL